MGFVLLMHIFHIILQAVFIRTENVAETFCMNNYLFLGGSHKTVNKIKSLKRHMLEKCFL